MNSTQRTLAIVAVTALLAAGFIGFAYAYTTQTDITENTAPSEYFLISSGDDIPTQDSYKEQFVTPVTYDTVITGGNYTVGTQTYLHKVEYMLNTDAQAMTGSAFGMKIVELGSIRLAIATQDGAAPYYGGVRSGTPTYDIEVLIPADKVDEDLYYFAKAVESGTDEDKTFAPEDETVEKFVKITERGVAYYAVYLTVPDNNSYYTVYIGAAMKGDTPKVLYCNDLPDEAAKVLDDATITFRVNSDSLMNGGNSMLIDVSSSDSPAYVAEVISAVSAKEGAENNEIVAQPFLATLAYGNGDLMSGTLTSEDEAGFKLKMKSGEAWVDDTQVDVAAEGIKLIAGTSSLKAVAGDHQITVALKDNQSAWKVGGEDVEVEAEASTPAIFALTYTLGAIKLTTDSAYSEATQLVQDILVMPQTGVRVLTLEDGFTATGATLKNGEADVSGFSYAGGKITTSEVANAGDYTLTVTATKDYCEYTNEYELAVRTASLNAVPGTLYYGVIGDETVFADYAMLVPTNGQDKVKVAHSVDEDKLDIIKASKYRAQAISATDEDAHVDVYVIVQGKDNSGKTIYSAIDKQFDVVSATLTPITLKVNASDVTPEVELSTGDDVTLTLTTSDSRYATVKNGKFHAVAAGPVTLTVSFEVTEGKYTFSVNTNVQSADP